MTLLKVSNFSLWYSNNFQALNKINVELQQQKITSLIGPSGCGKSTFLRCLNRLNEELDQVKTAGEIHFGVDNIFSPQMDPVILRKKIGMVFQQPNPFPSLSIYENVALALRLNGEKKKTILNEIVEKSLIQAALWEEVKDKLHMPATSLSGGQAQRLCIARTIAPRPEVILMDEPTSALDPRATIKIEELMDGLRQDFTVIIVTHNMQQARRISDQTCFFVNGELLESSSTQDFFERPQHPKSIEYVSGKFS